MARTGGALSITTGLVAEVYEQIQARKVKARLRMLQHAQRLSGNVSTEGSAFDIRKIWLEN